MGYVRGEVAGKKEEEFIDSDVLINCTEDQLHEIYDGRHGHLIPYFLGDDYAVETPFNEVRRKIKNPHSITGSWDCVEMAYSNFDNQPSSQDTREEHFPNAHLYQEAYYKFFDALKRESARIGE